MPLTAEEAIAHFMLRDRDLAAIVENTPYVPTGLREMGLTTPRPVTTTTVKVYSKDNTIGLVPTSERGGPIDQDMPTQEEMRTLPTFRLAKGMTLYAEELQDIVTFGEGSARVRAAAEIRRRVADLERDMGLSEEKCLLAMVTKGQMIDPKTDDVLVDYFTEWGIAKPSAVNWDLANASLTDLRLKASALERLMRKTLKLPFTRVGAIVGDDFYDALVTHAEVEKLYLNHAAALDLKNDNAQPFGVFPFAGINWINYRGTDDGSTISVDADKAYFFPIGARSAFLDVRAPGEDFGSVNQRGRRRYLRQSRDLQHSTWVKNDLITYPNYVVTRPQALQSATMA